jgi:hypothetical protein
MRPPTWQVAVLITTTWALDWGTMLVRGRQQKRNYAGRTEDSSININIMWVLCSVTFEERHFGHRPDPQRWL